MASKGRLRQQASNARDNERDPRSALIRPDTGDTFEHGKATGEFTQNLLNLI
jgi:hypothetical protein